MVVCSNQKKEFNRQDFLELRKRNLEDVTKKYNNTISQSNSDSKIVDLQKKLVKNNIETIDLILDQQSKINKNSNTVDDIKKQLIEYQELIKINKEKGYINEKRKTNTVSKLEQVESQYIIYLSCIIFVFIVSILLLIFL